MHLYGRDVQIQRLQEAYSRCKRNGIPECVLVTGASGMGKTSLVQNALRPMVLCDDDAFFIWGKFEFSQQQHHHHRHPPYGAIRMAFEQLVKQLMAHKRLDEIQTILTNTLGKERLQILVNVIPELQPVLRMNEPITTTTTTVNNNNGDTTRTTTSLARFQFVFASFCQSFSFLVPLVLFLDDTQWCDQASLELIQALLHFNFISTMSSSTCCREKSALLLVLASRDESDLLEKVESDCRVLFHPDVVVSEDSNDVQPTAAPPPPTLKVDRIPLDSLNQAETHELVAGILGLDEESSQYLATLTYAKYHGNAMHTLQYLKSIQDVRFNKSQGHNNDGDNDDDDKEKEEQIDGGKNNEEEQVDDVYAKAIAHHDGSQQQQQQQQQQRETVEEWILYRIHKLPRLVQELLRVAACMGNMIDERALLTIVEYDEEAQMDAHETSVDAEQIVTAALDTATEEEILEFLPECNRYRFAHDSVRQAVLSNIVDSRDMSFRIGHVLWKQSSPLFYEQDSNNLFTVVNLLNEGIHVMHDKDERYKAAQLNLMVGRRASAKVSFRDASRYYHAGIEFLDETKIVMMKSGEHNDTSSGVDATISTGWTDQYDLSLQLHDAAASAELANQNFQQIELLVETILKHARCFKDKLNAYAIRIAATGQQGMVLEATNMGLDVLRQLEEPVPSEPDQIKAVVAATEHELSQRSNTDILALPYLVDDDKKAVMRFLLMLLPFAQEGGSPYDVWIPARVIQLTSCYGITKGCAHGFSSFARFISRTNAKLGYKWGKLALMIVKKCQATQLMPRVYVGMFSSIAHWTRPLRETMEPLQQAFEAALENGDVEYAALAAFFRSFHALHVGMTLGAVQQLLTEIRSLMSLSKQALFVKLTNVALQFVQSLMTFNSVSPLSSKHDASSIVLLLKEGKSKNDNNFWDQLKDVPKFFSFILLGFSGELAYLFGDMAMADQFAEALCQVNSRSQFASYPLALHRFHLGLIAAAQVRNGVDVEKNYEICQSCAKNLVRWARDCPDNFLNKKSLLEAEMKSLTTMMTTESTSSSSLVVDKDNHIVSLYRQAIEGALEEGFLEEAAIACERAGDYVHRHGDIDEAICFWNHAETIFREWGALAKAEELQERTKACTVTVGFELSC